MKYLVLALVFLATVAATPEIPDVRILVAQREVQLCRNDRDAKDNALARMQLQLDLMAERLKQAETKTAEPVK